MSTEEQKEKRRAYLREYYKKNKEKYREKRNEYSREWRKRNPEKAKSITKRYIERNPEKHKESCKRWREKNHDFQKKYRENNIDKYAASIKRHNGKIAINRRIKNKKRIISCNIQYYQKEISRLSMLGKSAVDIAIRLSMPVSSIQSILNIQNANS